MLRYILPFDVGLPGSPVVSMILQPWAERTPIAVTNASDIMYLNEIAMSVPHCYNVEETNGFQSQSSRKFLRKAFSVQPGEQAAVRKFA